MQARLAGLAWAVSQVMASPLSVVEFVFFASLVGPRRVIRVAWAASASLTPT